MKIVKYMFAEFKLVHFVETFCELCARERERERYAVKTFVQINHSIDLKIKWGLLIAV